MLREAGASRERSSHGHGVSARRRVVTSVAVGACGGVLSAFIMPWELAPLVGWDIAAVTFVTWMWLGIWKLDGEETADHAEREDPTRAAADLALVLAAVASLLAVGYVIFSAGRPKTFWDIVQVVFGVASVVCSWTVIHTMFTVRYARMYYAGGDGGVDFHQDGKPRYTDFAYLAFTVGMTFQVSDTEVNTSAFRAAILRHALLSYLFGTVIVALTINLVAGLSK